MDAHKNFAVTDVTVAPSPATSGTSLTVTDASVFPAVPFNATICPTGSIPTPANAEIVRVTNIAGNVLTITRTQESTSARTVIVGDLIACTATAKVFTDIETGYIGTATAFSNVTATANSAGLSIDARGYAGTNTTFAGTNVSASATLNSAGLNLALSAPAPLTTLSYWQDGDHIVYATNAANSLVSVRKLVLQAPVVFSNVRLIASLTVATQTNNSSAFVDYSQSVVLYTRNGSTLSSINSGSATGTATYSSNATASVVGGVFFPVPLASATTLVPGEYWLAAHLSFTNTATGGAATTALGNSATMYVSVLGGTAVYVNMHNLGAGSNNTFGLVPGQGLISTGQTLASIPFTSISATGSRGVLCQVAVQLRNYTI